MTTLGDYFYLIAVDIHTPAWNTQTGCRFEGNTDQYILTAGYSTQDAAGMITQKTIGCYLVPVLCAQMLNTIKPGTNFHRFGGIDTHHGCCEVRIQLAIHGLTQACWYISGDGRYTRPTGISGLSQLP